MKSVLFALSAALFAASPAAASPTKAVAKATDWSKRVVATTDGGFAMGNPNAKVTLVEYGSLTCPHCRHFAQEGMKPLVDGYVKSGKVRFEFRNYLLNGFDAAATLVARCGGAAHFFPIAEAMYADQPAWLDRAQSAPKEKRDALSDLPPEKLLPALAAMAGVQRYGAAHGVSEAQSAQCLADPAAIEKLIGYARTASERYGVNGTPSFFINGSRIQGGTWAEVKPQIDAALKQ